VAGIRDEFRPRVAQRLDSGEIACFWSDSAQREAAVTMHSGGKSWLRAAFALPVTLANPRILGCSDGSLVITSEGVTVVQIPPGASEPKIMTLPDELFHPPKKVMTGQGAFRHYYPILAIEDKLHHVWLYSYALTEDNYNTYRLKGPVQIKDGALQLQKIEGMEEDSALSVIAPKDEHHLWLAKVGTGRFEVDLDSMTARPANVPVPDQFRYMEQIFRSGSDCYAITTSQPTEIGGPSPDIHTASTVTLGIVIHYDTIRNVGSLWKWTPGGWNLRFEGLDQTPDFYTGWAERSHCPLAQGLLLRTFGSAPCFVPNDERKPALRMDWHRRLSLDLARGYCAKGDNTILASKGHDEIISETIDTAPFDESKFRAQVFRFQHGLAQTSDGRLWGISGEYQFSEWDGARWTVHKFPKFCQPLVAFFAADDRDRIWICDWHDDPETVVYDPKHEKMEKFPSFTKALQKQLPKGIALRLAHNEGMSFRANREYFQPVFSPDGRIGFIGPQGVIFYYNGAKWRHWKPREVAADGLTISAPPFFDGDHRFCLQAGDTYRWQEKNGWEKLKESEAPPFDIEKPSFSLPSNCQAEGVQSVVQDRVLRLHPKAD
jgi:hypothetical protein